ncbi:hypothetical protein [Polyangium mundeleinium]|uniref:Uncharacterized protein n=1 Tax=Polyangium mundeleinium TaxID=2995306 RepID=A0ABT5EXY8_9BACT|nr:hypothetical protein [Polyangium mundeleinium]MDC0746691.1 hypothetical protein [Polyangium mundeleinium]
MAKPKKTKRRVLILSGPDRGRKAYADRVNTLLESCRVSLVEKGEERTYFVSLDAVSFDDELEAKPIDYPGLSPSQQRELEASGFRIIE